MPPSARLRAALLATAWLLALLVAGRAFAQPPQDGRPATAGIAEELAAVKAAAQEQYFAAAWKHCDRIVSLAQAAGPDALTGPDLYALGVARYYLVAEALDKALAAGGLEPEEAQFAQAMRDHIMAPPPDVATIGFGRRVRLERHLADGKTTIVVFCTNACPQCRLLMPVLDDLVERRPDLALRRVDINRPGAEGIDWKSPVARQFGITSLPHVKVFGPDKKLIAEGDPALTMVQQWAGE